MTTATTLSSTEIRQLDTILASFARNPGHPMTPERTEHVRALVLAPTTAQWDKLYRTALDCAGDLSLWAALCMVSDFPAQVLVDAIDRRHWNAAPTTRDLMQALIYAAS